MKRILVLVSFLLGCTQFTFADELGKGIKINRSWKMTAEDHPGFSAVNYNDSSWILSDSNNSFNGIFEEDFKRIDFKGVAWFRCMVTVDSEIVNKPFQISLFSASAAEVFIDGKSILKQGAFREDSSGLEYEHHGSLPQAFYSFSSGGAHVIAVRLVRYTKPGILKDNDALQMMLAFQNPIRSVNDLLLNSILLGVGLLTGAGVMFCLAFIHLTLYFYRRADKSNMAFAIFCICACLLLSFTYSIFPTTSLNKLNIIEVVVNVLFVLTFFFYYRFNIILYGAGRIRKALSLFFLVFFLVWAVFKFDQEWNTYWSIGVVSITLLDSFILLVSGLKKRMISARFHLAGIIVLMVCFLRMMYQVFVIRKYEIGYDASFIKYVGVWITGILSIPISSSVFLAYHHSKTNKNLVTETGKNALLLQEKADILTNQNEILEREVAARTNDLRIEKKKSDDLLLNILPGEIAEELKTLGESKAQLFNEATVLFTDFVGFTETSERLGVERILNELNVNFTAFDRIMEKHSLEKIKTIGDAYLAVSGLPVADPDHASNAVRAALDILEFVEKRKAEIPLALDIRIGINSGPLIAGIIGVKKFAYDIWGDTVNTAARMEQSSEPGKINISENTYRLVKDGFQFEYRGQIRAKGKGDVKMYFVTGR